MLLSKVTRRWNIPCNRKKTKPKQKTQPNKTKPNKTTTTKPHTHKKGNKNHKDTSLWSISMDPAWPALRQSWKALPDLYWLPRSHQAELTCSVSTKVLYKQILHVSRSFWSRGPWGLQPQSSLSALLVWTQPQPCLLVPAVLEPFLTPCSVQWLQHKFSPLPQETRMSCGPPWPHL